MRKAQVRKTLHRSYKLFKRFGFGFDSGSRGERRGPSFRDMLEQYREEQYWLALDELVEERLSYLAEYEDGLAWSAWERELEQAAIRISREYRWSGGFRATEAEWDGYDSGYDYDDRYDRDHDSYDPYEYDDYYDDYDSHVVQDTTFRCKRHQDCLANPQLAEACVAERIAGLQRKKAS